MNVGDYVRTKDGIIQKITNVFNTSMEIATNRGQRIYRYIDIVKSSPQIIDLIEVGDYVNGCLVSEIKDKWLILNYADIETYEQLERKNENIKSIVTHEQMEAIQYRVEE